MTWRIFDLQRLIDEVFVDDWLYPWQSEVAKGDVSCEPIPRAGDRVSWRMLSAVFAETHPNA